MSSTVTLYFGTDRIQYKIPSALLPSDITPSETCWDGRRVVYLSDIDPDIAHSFVHFLHTGRYETLWSGETDFVAKNIREHKRAISLYVSGGKYGLKNLQSLAVERISLIDQDVPVGDVLEHIEAAFSKISDSDEWLTAYLNDVLKKTFTAYSSTSEVTPHRQVGSGFARAMLDSVAVIFAAIHRENADRM